MIINTGTRPYNCKKFTKTLIPSTGKTWLLLAAKVNQTGKTRLSGIAACRMPNILNKNDSNQLRNKKMGLIWLVSKFNLYNVRFQLKWKFWINKSKHCSWPKSSSKTVNHKEDKGKISKRWCTICLNHRKTKNYAQTIRLLLSNALFKKKILRCLRVCSRRRVLIIWRLSKSKSKNFKVSKNTKKILLRMG